jgi:hypothetical protein
MRMRWTRAPEPQPNETESLIVSEMFVSLLPWTHAWCETCNQVQPFETEVLPRDAEHDTEALDLICGTCQSIIATLERRPTVTPEA